MRLKEVKDELIKLITNGNSAGNELRELFEYFQLYGSINFTYESAKESGEIIARSMNFKFGSIITSGRNPKEIDENIKDAILTAFEIPSAYLAECTLVKVGDQKEAHYALA